MTSSMFPPEVTKEWKDDELKALVGKFALVAVPATDNYKLSVPGAKYEGGTGIVAAATHFPVDRRSAVLWDYGMGQAWDSEAGAYIGVCDSPDHGDHLATKEGIACAETMSALLPES